MIGYEFKMATVWMKKIISELKDDVELGCTVNCSMFTVHEMRLDGSSKCFDYKTS